MEIESQGLRILDWKKYRKLGERRGMSGFAREKKEGWQAGIFNTPI